MGKILVKDLRNWWVKIGYWILKRLKRNGYLVVLDALKKLMLAFKSINLKFEISFGER